MLKNYNNKYNKKREKKNQKNKSQKKRTLCMSKGLKQKLRMKNKLLKKKEKLIKAFKEGKLDLVHRLRQDGKGVKIRHRSQFRVCRYKNNKAHHLSKLTQ